jgi:hypothetical protein
VSTWATTPLDVNFTLMGHHHITLLKQAKDLPRSPMVPRGPLDFVINISQVKFAAMFFYDYSHE